MRPLMIRRRLFLAAITFASLPVSLKADPPAFPEDPAQALERTSFQTSKPWSPQGNLWADVAVVYGMGMGWRERGYRGHLMTGVLWGDDQDYLYGNTTARTTKTTRRRIAMGARSGTAAMSSTIFLN